jgi:hypothetical protein
MQLSWEAVAAIASLLSSIAVLAAIVVGVRQVRVSAAQIEHLRRATQLEGTLKIFDMLGSPEQFDARRFVVQGVYVKHGLLDEAILFDFWSSPPARSRSGPAPARG